jgi:hypothetical protein
VTGRKRWSCGDWEDRTGRKLEVPETTRMKGQADREGVSESRMKEQAESWMFRRLG